MSEYAQRHGISAQRARTLAAQGRLEARKVGSQWLVTDSGAERAARRAGRPPSTETVWAAALALEPEHGCGAVDPQRRRAVDRLLVQFIDAEGSYRLILVHSTMANRGEPRFVRAADPEDLADDPRVARSGMAWSHSPLRSVDGIDLYVREGDWDSLRRDHALVQVPRSRSNVRVRTVPDNVELGRDVPALVAAADLGEVASPRAAKAAKQVLDWLLARAPQKRIHGCD